MLQPDTAIEPRPPRRWPVIAGISALAIAGVLAALVLIRPKPQATPIPPPAAATASSSVPPVTTSIEVVEPPQEQDDVLQPTTTTAVVIEPVNKAPSLEKTADDFYNDGLARLVERQPFRAREAFEAAVERDPTHAQAHFRLGEMALFGRDFPQARQELNAALLNSERLDVRERKLTELGLALLDRNRARAETLAKELEAMNPRDPDLLRFRALMRSSRQ